MNPQNENPVLIFADGACSGNPGPGGWGAIIAKPSGQIIELGGREAPTTNNRMELTAVIRALESLHKYDGGIEIYTDSTYVIRGITQWIWGWRKRGWISSEGKDVANSELWKALSALVAHHKIAWKYVRGHSGVPGNERVDQIAVSFAQGHRLQLYQGPLLKYDVPIHDIPEDTQLPEMKSKETKSKAKPHSYLSLVGNAPMRHNSWTECEGRVKGRSGAKFKKAMTSSEEIEILRSWGFKPEDLPE